MTLEQLKAEVAKLTPEDRTTLAEWIEQCEDVVAIRQEELVSAINLGIEEADRGELMEADEVFAALRAGLRTQAD